MSSLIEDVAAYVARHDLLRPGARVLVGVSGGVDSLTLLHVLLRLSEPLRLGLHAATLDHGLRGAASAEDVAYVRRTAEAWGVPVSVGYADVEEAAVSAGLGLEEAARQVRYTFLLGVAQQIGAEMIAVGHNRDDQAETVLMHLIRGSGLSGLRGMLPATPLSEYHLLPAAPIQWEPARADGALTLQGWPTLIRPLLDVPRSAIEAYAAANHLQPRYDASNEDLTFFRNRLRHEVIPLLETLNPNLRAMLARTADVLRADAELVERMGQAALAYVVRETRRGVIVLEREAWGSLSLSEKRHVIRALLFRLRPELRDVSYVHVEQAIDVADRGGTGAQATLPGGLVLRVGYGVMLLGPADEALFDALPGEDAPALDPDEATGRFFPGDTVERRFGAWRFECRPLAEGETLRALHADPLAAALAVPRAAWLQLRTRRPGDRFQPRGMGGQSQKLSDTLINMRVPVAWRDRLPLLTVDDEIAWFVAPAEEGVRSRVAEPFAVRDLGIAPIASGGLLIVVRWVRENPG